MCFRPGDVNLTRPCPECGKKLHATSGVFPKTCPFCKASLEGLVDPSTLGMTSGAPAHSAPAPPKVPRMPTPPAMPGSKASGVAGGGGDAGRS